MSKPSTDCMPHGPKPPEGVRKVMVERAVDGDTVTLQGGTTVRLVGINTPESVDPGRPAQPYGKEASTFTQQLLAGRTVLMQIGTTPVDSHGRTLAWLWFPDGRFVNALLVHHGMAQVYTFPDNPEHEQLLLACQREAREAGRGLWSLKVYRSGKEAAKMGR